MIAYASRTGTRRNLAALRAHGWRLLVSAVACLRSEGFQYALDNGAWSAFTQRRPRTDTKVGPLSFLSPQVYSVRIEENSRSGVE